jgi:hypothetical protein
VARGTASQVLEAECVVREAAHPHRDDTNQPILRGVMRVPQTGDVEGIHRPNHFALKTKLYGRAVQVAIDALLQLEPIRLAA